jgi:hypothetical protein
MNRLLPVFFALVIIFSGCGRLASYEQEEEEKEIDVGEIVNVIVRMTVVDVNGENLLDPGTEGSFAGSEELFADFRKEVFYLDQDIGEDGPQSPEIMFYGLFSQHFEGFPYWLVFGGLDAYKDIDNEDLTIHWPNGRTDVVTIYNKYDFKKRDCDRKFYLNGSEVESEFTIVL